MENNIYDNNNIEDDEENLEIDIYEEKNDKKNYDEENTGPIDITSMYFKDLPAGSLLTAEEEIELAKRIEQGDEKAKQIFIKKNLRLVISIAKKSMANKKHKLDFLDLIQDGNIGLEIAVDKYDYRMGNRFSTYATWWIKQSIQRGIQNKGSIMRIPVYLLQYYNKINAIQNEANGKKYTTKELAEMLDTTEKNIEKALLINSNVSLEDVIDEKNNTRIDVVENTKAENPYKKLKTTALKNNLDKLLKILNSREEIIIRLKYDIKNDSSKTYEEIAYILDLTQERVRQLEKSALSKLRQPQNRKKISDFKN